MRSEDDTNLPIVILLSYGDLSLQFSLSVEVIERWIEDVRCLGVKISGRSAGRFSTAVTVYTKKGKEVRL